MPADRHPATFVDLLRARSSEAPERAAYTFLADGEEVADRLSYGELDAWARRIAARLLAEGPERVVGERALLLFPPGLEFAAAFLGCLYAGVVAVPAYPPRPGRQAGRLEAIAADARPRFALTTAQIAARWGSLAAGSGALGAVRCLEVPERGDPGPVELPRIGPETLAFLQYTSGSTATPKGVEVRHSHLLFMERLIGEVFEQGPESVVVGWLPLYHDMGLIGNLLQPLYTGGHCVLMSPVAFLRRPRRWLEAISRFRGTTSGGPSFAYELCAERVGPEERAGLDLSSWRVAFNGAEPVRAATLARFAEAFGPCGFRGAAYQPCYGLAEATLLVSGVRGGRGGHGPRVLSVRADRLQRGRIEAAGPEEPGDSGRTVELVGCGGVPASQRVEIVNPVTLRRALPGQVGEIWVAGPGVASGYWRRPEETARDFAARIVGPGGEEQEGMFLRTGDLGFLADGELFVTGRFKDLIILRGRNLYPQDVEWTAERSAPELAAGGSAAFSVEVDGEERLVVVQEVKPRTRLDGLGIERLAAAVRRVVAEEHEAQVYEVVLLAPGALPKTSSGKVQRRECRKRYLAGELESVGRSRLDAETAAEPEVALSCEGLLALPTAERPAALARELRLRAVAALGVPELGRDQPLLDLGLDSLAAIDLVHGIGRDFGVELPLEALLEGASCAGLAELLLGTIVNVRGGGSSPLPQPPPPRGEGPTLPAAQLAGEVWTGLSYGERALWLLDGLLPPEDASYRLAAAARLSGPVSSAALRAAFQELVDRHEALRTTYPLDEETGEPYRRVAERSEVGFAERDATGWTAERLTQEIEAEAWRPFDLARGPLLRVSLFTGAAEGPVLLVSLHHIVADFGSLALLARQLGGAVSLAPAYSAFARRQTAELEGPRGEELWAWWRERLANLPTAAALPYDRPPEPGEPLSGPAGVVRLDFGPQRTQLLLALARGQGVTLYAALLALQAALLSRLTGETDLTVGAPAAGRPEAPETVGYFANPLVLRFALEDDPAYSAVLAQARERLTGALAHQDLPLPLLVERLRREQPAGEVEPFRTMLSLYQAPAGAEGLVSLALGEEGGPLSLGALELVPLPLRPRSSQFDLTLSLGLRNGRLGGLLVYHAGRFEAPTMHRLVAQLETLLDGVLEQPEGRLSALPLLPEAARHQLVFEANDQPAEAPAWTALEEGFERQARETPERTALVSGNERTTYEELNHRANCLARHLQKLGVKVEDRVGVLLGRTPEIVASLLGVLKAGAAYVPLDPSLPEERLSFLLEDSGASLLVTRRVLADRLPDRVPRLLLDEEAAAASGEDGGEDLPRLGDRRRTLAYVIYTSGSTGRPKGVGIEHGSALHLMGWARRTYGDAELAGVLASTSIGFDLSVFELFTPLSFGGTVILADSALALPGLPAAGEVTLLNTVPSAMAALLDVWLDGDALPPRLATVNLAGEPLRRSLAERVLGPLTPWPPLPSPPLPPGEGERSRTGVTVGGDLKATALDPNAPPIGEIPSPASPLSRGQGGRWERGPGGEGRIRLFNLYGPSEDTTYSTGWRLEPGETGEPPIGRPLAGSRAYVVAPADAALTLVPPGVAGELYLGGSGLARGYLGRPELTADRWMPDPFGGEPGGRLYRTGDRVRQRPDGVLVYLGRLDRQLKIRGFRIEPGEVEAALLAHPEVREAAVVRRSGTDTLAAYVVLGEDSAAGVESELLALLGRRLPAPLVPSSVTLLDALPLTANGKVDRRALEALAAAAVERNATAPQGEAEERLAGIWAELLGTEAAQIGRESRFFDLGGHSLLAARLVARIRRAFGVELPLSLAFEAPRLFDQARRIEDGRREAVPQIPRRAEGDGAERLSFAQERLWFLDQLSPGQAVYNMPVALWLSGRLDVPSLARALGGIVRRHEALRTVFTGGDGTPFATVRPAEETFPLPMVDLAGRSGARAEALRRAREEAERPFDLAAGPLLRAVLLRLSGEEHLLVLVLHHIVADGWSLDVLARELGASYEGVALPELPIRYADYAAWQRADLTEEILAPELAAWAERLRGLPLVLSVPGDRPRTPVQSFRGGTASLTLPGVLREALGGLASRSGATPFLLWLAGFTVLLSRLTGETDLAVGTAVANRTRIETEGLIGLFVNSLVVRGDVSGDPSFAGLLDRTREAALWAFAHQDLPFEKLVEALAPVRALSHAPLFQVMLVAEVSAPAAALPGLSVRRQPLATGTAKLDLLLTLSADGSSCELEYNRDLFDSTTAVRLLGHLETLLAAAVDFPEWQLSELTLLPEAERQQILVEWNASAMPETALRGGATLPERFAAQAVRTPEAVAVVHGTERVTYGELARRAGRMAERLVGLGVGPEVRVGVLLPRTPDLVATLLGVLAAGGAYLPLDPRQPAARLAWVLEDAGAALLVSEPEMAAQLPGWAGRTVFPYAEEVGYGSLPPGREAGWVWGEVRRGGHVQPTPARGGGTHGLPATTPEGLQFLRTNGGGAFPTSLAYVIYTSGSTGRPKGVAIEHRSAMALLDWGAERFSPQELAGVLAATAISFDLSVFEIFLPLTTGGSVILAKDALELASLAAAAEVTLVNTVPSALAEILRLGGLPPSVRTVNLAGEPLPALLAADIYRQPRVERLWNLYGPSEDTTYSTESRVPRGGAQPAIGRPLPGTQAHVLDGALQPLPVGVPGELFLGGAGLARGYLGRPGLTAARFVPHPFGPPGTRLYRTGDLARFRPDGELDFLGRADHQVKVRGFRIELGEIEAVLAEHPAVRGAAVLVEERAAGARLVACWAPHRPDAAGSDPDPAELRAFLRDRLPEPMVPAVFLRLAALPLTPNGKVDRKAMAETLRGEERPEGTDIPRTQTEERIVAIWREVLEEPEGGRIDPAASFFEIGGHSLLATRVMSRLRGAFGVELPVRTLFEAPSVRDLARRVEAAMGTPMGTPKGTQHRPLPPISPRDEPGPPPLSFAQERLWLLDRLGAGAVYNIPLALTNRGALDPARLVAALTAVARRHEALRTTFAEERRAVQVIAPAELVTIPLPVIDLTAVPAGEIEASRLAGEEAGRPFDLSHGPLLRAALLRMADREHVLVLNLHHIVADGWSLGVLVAEIAALYRGDSPLPELAIQYADFAVWQRRWLDSAELARQMRFWRERLAGVPGSLGFPMDRPRPALQSFRGASISFEIGPELTAGILALGHRAGATPFMTLLAGFVALLRRITGQEDFVIGTPIANRNLLETEKLIGFFVNSLALRQDLTGNPSVAGLLDRVLEASLAAYAHQDLPFEKLVEELRPERHLARNPLFQVMFAFQNAPLVPLAEIDLPGLTLEPFPFPVPTAKLDLQLDLTEVETPAGKALAAELRYATDLFDRATVERLAAGFLAILEAMASNPELRVADLPLLGEAEWQEALARCAEWRVEEEQDAAAGRPEHVAPGTPEEQALAAIWAELLDLPDLPALEPRIGTADSFFALGGHSLLATQVVARLRERFGVELPMRAVFEEPTLAALAARVAAERRAVLGAGTGAEDGPLPLPPLERAAGHEGALWPASFSQRRLWFLDRFEPGTALYNIPAALAVHGDLNVAALAAALSEIARRHEALRTVFAEEAGEPVQRVLEPGPLPVPVIDLAALPPATRRGVARELAAAEAGAPFDLARGPLWRVRLLRLEPREHQALLTLHHTVSDGWSTEVLVREVAALYPAFAAGHPSPLRELPVQYGDYAVWQRRWLTGPLLERELAYWRRQLADAAPLDLPADRPRPAVATNRGALFSWELPGPLAARLQGLSRRYGATLFSTLLAGFQAFLLRLSGQDDVSVGTPVAGRSHVEIEGLIGFFVNTLVLRLQLAGDAPFRDLLARARETSLAAQAHQAVPFDRLVEELAPERSLSRSPLFQAMFALQTAPRTALNLPGLTLEPVPLERPAGDTAKFDLTLTVDEGPRGLAASFEYATDLFDRATVARWAGHLERLLAAAVENPSRRLSDLPLLTDAERHQGAVGWNDTASEAAPAATLYELFVRRAERTPGAPALEGPDESLTYRELRNRAERLAAELRSRGVVPEQAVAVCLERSPSLVVGLLGTLAAGGVYLPVDPALPQPRRDLLLADSGARVLVTDAKRLASWQVPQGIEVLRLDEAVEGEASGTAAVLPGHAAYLIYTSGSSGQPKGVVVTHEAAALQCRAAIRTYGLTAADRLFQLTSAGFDVSLEEILPTLLAGATIVLWPELPPPAGLQAELARHRITLAHFPTAYWQQWVREASSTVGALYPPLRLAVVGSEAMSPRTIPAWEALRRAAFPAARLVNGYGPTEAVITATAHEVGPEDAGEGAAVSIGRAMPDRAAYVVDRHGGLQPVGVPGELWLGGILARGYLGDPARTAERFIPDPFGLPGGRLYRTGDLARREAAGEISFLGRIDHQVKVRGFRVELSEIEAALAGIPGVREAVAAVYGEGDARRLAAFYVPEPGVALEPAHLRDALRDQLPGPLVPGAFVPLPALPLTPNGKVDRRALPDPFVAAAGEAAGKHSEARRPRTPVEQVVAAIWCDVLELSEVGLSESFFDLGGHSLLATRVGSRLRVAFGVELPLRDLFERSTVEALAARVEEARREAEGEGRAPAPPITREPREVPGPALPLSFAQQRLWFLDQMESGGSAYNIPFAVRLDGPLDPGLLAGVLSEIVRRHEALRTRFEGGAGSDPAQVIDPPAPFALPLVDLSGLAASESEARRLAAVLDPLPFDLARGPLLRGWLLRLAPARHVLLAAMHHIVSDEWSMRILLRDLLTLYRALGSGLPSPLPELPVQYADYALWQRRWLQGEALAGQLAFWRERLQGDRGEPPVLELPADRPRPAVQSYRGGVLPLRLPDGLSRSLLRLSRRASATPFMTLLAAFAALLGRSTGQSDLAIGTPISGRTRLEVEEVIGFFLNTLVLRVDLAADSSFSGLLAQVRERSLAAYAHQDLPFEKLVDELRPRRSLAHSPFFQALFVLLHEAPLDEEVVPGLRLSSLPNEQKTAKFDLTLSLAATTAGNLSGSWEYAADLFDRTTVARFSGHFETLLAALAEDPELPVSHLPLSSASEAHQILREWNDTEAPRLGEALVHEVFAAVARRHPERQAVVWASEAGGSVGSWTYAELASRAGSLAAHLRGAGVGPEVAVGVLAERGPLLAAAVLAVLQAGGAYLPLDPAYPRERLLFLLADVGAPVLLTQGDSGKDLGPPHEIDLETFPWTAPVPMAPTALVDPDTTSYLIYTSGSTGKPKGSALPHRSLANLIAWKIATLAREGADPALRTLQFASPSFDVSLEELFATWCAGGTLVVVTEAARRDPRLLVELLEREAVERLFLPYVALQQLAEHLAGDSEAPVPSRLREVVTAGERLQITPQIAALFRRLPGCALRNQYGPSETHVVTEHALRGDPDRWPLLPPIGRPVAGTAAYVLGVPGVADVAGLASPLGVAGELALGGVSLSRGYIHRPGLTADKFVPDPFSGSPGARLYRTGDRVRLRPDGEIEFLGRIDDQVKVRGFRVEPGEIEVALAAHPAVREAVVVVRGDGSSAERRLVAYVVLAGEPSLESLPVSELRAFLAERLPEHMIPGAFVALPALPLTGSGKVQRSALPEPEEVRAMPYVAPSTALEKIVAEVVAAQLGGRQVGREDNFFDAGAHSLLLVRVAGELSRRLGRKVAVVDLFRFPTVTALARHLGEGAGGEKDIRDGRDIRDIRDVKDKRMNPETRPFEQIAIVGMACRFPGASDVEQFWRNLSGGVESLTFLSEEELIQNPAYIKAAGVIDGPDLFDADFFGYSPREAELMDPQLRLFLECAWQACEDAGYAPQTWPGRIGVYGGAAAGTYFLHNVLTNPEVLAAAGGMQAKLLNDKDFLTTHVSYRLNLRGPSMTIQTACSTSLVAVHVACQALLHGECDMALAGGSGISFPHRAGSLYQEGGINSPDGHCRAFDIRAQGLVDGNGTGVVLLKRLSDALADGDFIHAVVRGSAVNNDGAMKVGYTAPSVDSQADVIAEALAAARVEADTIGLVEAHGSGTPIGDPIEVQALTRAFRETTGRTGYCALGSIKTNVGHTDAAAGVAGLIKAVQALQHRQIPPSLHFEEPNPETGLPESPFFVPTRALDWPAEPSIPRRAGVSSLGIGGTNAHVVLEEAPPAPAAAPSRPWQLLVVSARTRTALDQAAARLADHLAQTPLSRFELADVAHTLRVGRKAFPHRRALLCRDRNEAAKALSNRESTDPSRWIEGTAPASGARPVAFLFPGLGEHYAGMAAGLYRSEPVFRAAIDRSSEILAPHLGVDLRELLVYWEGGYPVFDRAPSASGGKPDLRRLLAAEPEEEEDDASRQLGRTAFAHPAVFAVEHALAELWLAWGIRPRAMIGYSLGEYVAACLAGVFSLEDALALVAGRARLIDALPAGAMLAVPLSVAETEALLASEPGLELAAANGAGLSVVAGPAAAADAFARRLAERGVACRRLRTEHAFHSGMMRPAAAELTRLAAGMDLRPPSIPFVSNVTGTWITDEEATDPAYWAEHLCRPVRFASGLAALTVDEEAPILLEVGPGQTLGTLARQRPGRPSGETVVASLRDRRDEVSDQAFLLDALARLWAAGAAPDWTAFAGGERRRRRPLPTYPFERRRYFLTPGQGGSAAPSLQPGEDRRDPYARRELGDWFYEPVWERASREELDSRTEPLRWLILGAGAGLGVRLHERLATSGESVEHVPQPGDLRTLLAGRLPQRIVHLSSLDASASPEENSFYSLLALAQALAEIDPESRAGLHVGAVTSGVADVLGEETLVPERATLLGPCRVLPQEVPGVTSTVVDLPEGGLPADPLIDSLLAELARPRPEPLVALRGRRRFLRRFRPVALPPSEPAAHLRRGGVYLITGGLEETGVTLAEHLFRACGARLVLLAPEDTPPMGRWGDWLSSLDEHSAESRRLRRVLALSRSGCDLVVTPADLAHPGQVRQAVELALSRFGALHGVIHAGGKAGGGLLQWKTRAQAAAVLTPKVRGTRALADAVGSHPLDFFVLFGSNASATGGLGQADTAAAAGFLDVFAAAAEQRGSLPVRTIDWGYFRWQPVDAPTAEMAAALEQGLALYGITESELFEAFLRVLASPLPQVVVSTQDLGALTSQLDSLSAASLLDQIGDPAPGAHARPDLAVAYDPPRGEIEETVARLWQEAFGIDRVGRDDNFFDLAGNSLLAIQIVTRLSHALGVELSTASLLGAPTVAELAREIERLLPKADPIAGASEEALAALDAEELERLLREIESLSPDEADSKLARELEAR